MPLLPISSAGMRRTTYLNQRLAAIQDTHSSQRQRNIGVLNGSGDQIGKSQEWFEYNAADIGIVSR